MTLKGSAPARFGFAAAQLQPKRTVSSSSRSLCNENRFRNDGRLAERHHCMDGVDAQHVIQWLEETLA